MSRQLIGRTVLKNRSMPAAPVAGLAAAGVGSTPPTAAAAAAAAPGVGPAAAAAAPPSGAAPAAVAVPFSRAKPDGLSAQPLAAPRCSACSFKAACTQALGTLRVGCAAMNSSVICTGWGLQGLPGGSGGLGENPVREAGLGQPVGRAAMNASVICGWPRAREEGW